jgi:SagB-type dehydrogenase family enzyme
LNDDQQTYNSEDNDMSVTNPCQHEPPMQDTTIDVYAYHQRTKHSLEQYARGPDGLDWDTQPDPFRTYAGSERFAMPLHAGNIQTAYKDLYHPDRMTAVALTLRNVSALFELSLGLSSWKVYGATRWALRNNPSSGNLHPTEAYLVFPGMPDLPAGVYHYHVYRHSLELRCGVGTLDVIEQDRFLIGLSSLHWREAWKYGERAYRYCQLDVGHAIAAIRYAAAALGWSVTMLEGWSDAQISAVLGLDRDADHEEAERESPDVMLQIQRKTQDMNAESSAIDIDADSLIYQLMPGSWNGKANRLSPDNRVNWEVIDRIETFCTKPVTTPDAVSPYDKPVLMECETEMDAASVIRKRRSAQAFDGESSLPLSDFYRMLDCLQPRKAVPPFDTLVWAARVHVVLFIHRVDGLRPGLYVLPRSEGGEQLLRDNLREQFDWTRAPVCPDWLPLYHLVSANSRKAARTVSCHQAIAADGAFSLSMIAEFDQTVKDTPWRYRQLFWEAGMIGQTLYLEAEAADISGTGIGCFFDDTVHEILGIENTALQSMYHFTVGTAEKDSRLVSLPPYGHLKSRPPF